MKLNLIQLLFILIAIFMIGGGATAQNNRTDFTTDSVDLQKIVTSVIATHPSVLKAQEAINATDALIGLANSAYYPDINIGASYTRIGPVPAISIPGLGSFDMASANNYNTSLNISQKVYDFSKTKTNIQVAESGKAIAEKNVDLVKQKLTSITIASFYLLGYYQEAVKIKDLQLGILQQHLDFVNRKKETGSATDYEILSTKVRISAAKNQKTDMETALNDQLAILNSLLGLPEGSRIKVKNHLLLQPVNAEYDSLVDYALSHRNELMLVDLRKKQAELHLQSVKIENNPVLSAFASGGVKNGYFPDLNQPKLNYIAGLGFAVPIFTATRHKNYLQLANSEINTIKQDMEQGRREVSSEVYRNANDLHASMRKINQSQLQLQQAEEARKLAELSYKAGAITNLDLLDSQSIEAESRLNLLRVRTEYIINASRLDISIGKPGF